MAKTTATDLTPIKAIRAKCLDCSGWSTKEVRECQHDECVLYPYRLGKRPASTAPHTPIRSIRLFCLDCVCGTKEEIRRCPSKQCALHAYRMGKRPKQPIIPNVEVMAKNSELTHAFLANNPIESEVTSC